MANIVIFRELLGRYRTRCGWSQGELGAKVGVHRNTIASWESGDRSPQSRGELLRLADELLLSKEERDTFLKAAGFSIEHWHADYWNVPYQRNPYFVGRETVLQLLRHTGSGAKTTELTQSISGLGGIGKTQVAIEYAHRYGEYYTAVLWIQADSLEVAIAACLQLATQVLGLPKQQEAEQQIAEFKRWLQKHHKWLLILDNVEDPEAVLSAIVPSKHQGSVLITTRLRDVGPLAHSEVLPLLSEEEGALLLLRRAKRINLQASIEDATPDDVLAASKLCQLMDGLPLALDQAGAYIAENGYSLQRYRDLYEQSRPKLLQRRGLGDHPHSVLKTFCLSWEQIQQRNALAGKALAFCAFLAPEQIPEQLVLAGIMLSEAEKKPDEVEMDEALGLLYRYSLVERADQTLFLHRLVQEVIQESLSEEERRQWAQRAMQEVNAVFPSGEYGTWSECEDLLPHALACAKWISIFGQNTFEEARLLSATSRYLYKRGQYRQAEPLLQGALTICEQHLDSTHPLTAAAIRSDLAVLYWEQGKHAQAEPLYEHALENYQHALEVYEKQLGSEHPETVTIRNNTAAVRNNLAQLYQDQKKYTQAEPLLQDALDVCEKWLGLQHPETAISLNNLAQLYLDQKKYAQAEPLSQRALAICEQHLDSIDPLTAVAIHSNLALLYERQGKDEQAEPLYRRALEIHEQQLGPEHPSIAIICNNLAEFYQKQGKDEQAEPLYRRALEICKQQWGDIHSDTAAILHNLAEFYRKQGKYEQAEPLYWQALEIYEQGDTHPETAIICSNLALLYEGQGKYEQAEMLLKQAVKISLVSLGVEHYQTQQIIVNYQGFLKERDTNGDMVALLEMLLRREQDDHPRGERV